MQNTSDPGNANAYECGSHTTPPGFYTVSEQVHLSDVTKPLRDLTQKDIAWTWDHAQQQAFNDLKKAVTNTPVLRYYTLQEEVTLQSDASQTGLGAALLQKGQPVAYASHALTSAEIQYAQIEKELLAIIFACEHFDV